MRDLITPVSPHYPLSAIQSVSSGPKVASIAPQDTVSISSEALEAKKKMNWVEMLKQMPEVRDLSDRAHSDFHLTSKIIETISERLSENYTL
ncbi:MAG: hypothetical protein KDK55_02545 [Chlamydiia bacterium]|nr:hypothetical protein [Chlamydiia bacterium]